MFLNKKLKSGTMVKTLNILTRIRNIFLYSRGSLPLIMLIILLLVYVSILLFRSKPITPLPNIILQNIGGICNRTIPPSNLTTLLIMSYTNNEALMRLLSQYNDCSKFGGIIHEIVIVWNNPTLPFNWSHPRLQIDNITHKIPIHIYKQKENSLANRWFISRQHNFKTLSAIFIDDDMYINQYSISCMLHTFLRHKYKIIAPSRTNQRTTRQLIKSSKGKDKYGRVQWEYFNDKKPKYFNMLLPGMSMFNTKYLDELALTLEKYDLLNIINTQIAHCDDISMMLSMAMINNGNKYLFGIDYILIEDYSIYRTKQKAMTDKSEKNWIDIRYEQRSECLTMIMNKFIEYNKKMHQVVIIPIVKHEHSKDVINCRKCQWCDYRGCWHGKHKKK
eukprot:353639_1